MSDIRDRRYAAAYALGSPDLRRITAIATISQQDGAGATVVQLRVTRAARGVFAAHIAVTQAHGVRVVTTVDDLSSARLVQHRAVLPLQALCTGLDLAPKS